MKTAIILFNLGGPDSPEAVRPFLFNLFSDAAIFRLPFFLRLPLAWLVAKLRTPKAQHIYDQIGGSSPILANTQAQAAALESALGPDFKVFTCMRYWQPRAFEVAQAVKDYNPSSIVLLPLYPQYSTTTTASSVAEWQKVARAAGLTAPTKTLCCYPTDSGFIAAQAALVKTEMAKSPTPPRILFSAHGLPERVVAGGDPYQWQCEQTAQALAAALGITNPPSPSGSGEVSWVNCYQSKVGRLAWIGPSTEEAIIQAGIDKKPIVVVPIAFVSEHSETLVELDIDYKKLADTAGVPFYGRAGTVMADKVFIDGLASQVRNLMARDKVVCSQNGGRFCPHNFKECPVAA